MNLGAAYLQRGDLHTAEERLRQSADLFNQVGAEDFLPELERYLAELHLLRGDLPKARLACELSLTTALRLEARAEEGVTRRTLARIMAQDGDPDSAWAELERSLLILRESAGPHEIARTLLAIAALAPALSRHAQGQAAMAEALPALRDVGARRDLDQANSLVERFHYAV
jgi:tetratricopeptide (TPR) repeat protein